MGTRAGTPDGQELIIMIHTEVCFDVIGLSYYPFWYGPLAGLRDNVTALAARYDKDVVVETAYPWTLENPRAQPGRFCMREEQLPDVECLPRHAGGAGGVFRGAPFVFAGAIAETLTDRLIELAESLRALLAYDARPTGALFGTDGPLAFAASWATAFSHTGQALEAAANEGALERGTRDILAHHVIFHWNRIGLSYKTQSILAQAAETAIFS
jgi:glycosyl hydrolase family 53